MPSGLHHRLKAAAGASPTDPYFSSTSLLLLGNGTNGGQNNTFLDGSANNFTITCFGNTAQGSFSPFSASDGRWSNYFDGSGDYLTVSGSSNLAFGTGDFTIEFWLYLNTASVAQIIYDGRPSGVQTTQPCVYVMNDGTIRYYVSNLDRITGSSLSTSTWYHIALARSGTSTKLFVNGTQSGSTYSDSTNYTNTLGRPVIGVDGFGGANQLNGYISSLRVLKGTALYSSAFTPPTSPLTAVTNTSLLTCQSNRFKDNSSNAFTITPSGNAAVTSFSPFAPTAEYSASTNGGSGYFDGSGDYLNFTGITLSGDFCCECWYYRTANSTNYSTIFGGSSSGANANNHQFTITNTGGITLVLSSTAVITNAGTAFVNNAWNHVAYVRNGTNCAVFVNGVRQGTGTSSISTSVCSRIADIAGLSGYQPFGYISNARIVSGSSVYDPTATTFTPPTSPLTAITNTSLLLNFTNASIIDSTGKNNLETVGNAQVSTSVKKYGTGSMLFDGSTDMGFISRSSFNWSLGNTYTIECWAYADSVTGTKTLFNISPTFTANFGEVTLRTSGTSLNFSVRPANGSSVAQITAGTVSTGVWYHFAASVDSGSARLFINGSQVGSTTSVSSATFTPVGAAVGGYANAYSNTSLNWIGRIDDLRITKGVARYTANFTPPSAQLPSR